MFVVVTIFGVWLGWNLKIVRERKAIITAIAKPDDAATYFVTLEGQESGPSRRPSDGQYDHLRVSSSRRLLGDQSYIQISVRSNVDRQLLERAEYAFPEATFLVFVNDYMEVESFRDSLFSPARERQPNTGDFFKTGLIEK